MPGLTGSGVSPAQLERILRGTPMQGTGRAFVNAGRRYRVDPRLLVSIASAESSLGKYANGYNPFGWGPGHQFGSWAAAIQTVAGGLRSGYLDKGLKTIEQIGAKYAPSHAANDPSGLNSNWVKNVRSMYQQLGGSGALGAPGAPAAAGLPKLGTVKPVDLKPFLQQRMIDPGAGRRPTDVLNDLVQFIRSQPPAQIQRGSTQLAPGVTATVQGPASVLDRKAISLAQSYLGTPYVWGGSRPGGFDCSGLLQYVWGKQGIKIPRTTYDQINAGTAVKRGQLRPGDAIFFGTRANPHHVAMYLGNGRIIEAPHTGANVRVSSLRGRNDYVTARRYG